MTRPVYLDCAASSPLDPRVAERMNAMGTGNPGSRTHVYGDDARRAVESTRDQIAQVVGFRRSEVVFTSGATESNNLAILGIDPAGRRHIVTTLIEHPAVAEPVNELERRGFEVTRIAPLENGSVDAAILLAAVREDTLLVTVMHVNNETGAVQPIEAIADGLEKSRTHFHVDAAQSFGKLNAPLRHFRIDSIAASAHKICGPQGVGALLVRRTAQIRPLFYGGGQERGLRPGTLPATLIAGFGEASSLAIKEEGERLAKASEFKKALLAGLAPLDPQINGGADGSPFIVNLTIPGFDNETIMDAWAPQAAVSNGSACASSQQHCSYVLGAMGFERPRAEGAIRLSWCHLTPQPDWAAMVEAVQSIREVAHGNPA